MRNSGAVPVYKTTLGSRPAAFAMTLLMTLNTKDFDDFDAHDGLRLVRPLG
jgi:hypothetical protein